MAVEPADAKGTSPALLCSLDSPEKLTYTYREKEKDYRNLPASPQAVSLMCQTPIHSPLFGGELLAALCDANSSMSFYVEPC